MMGVAAGRIARIGLGLILSVTLFGCATPYTASQDQGEELAAQGRWEEAVRYYSEAVRNNPQSVEYRLGLARAMQEASEKFFQAGKEMEQAGRLEDAAAAYRRALDYSGENRPAQDGLDRIARLRQVRQQLARARELMDKRDWQAAQAEVAAALRLMPGDPDAKLLKQEIDAKLTAEAPPKRSAEPLDLFSTQPVTLRFRDTDIKDVLEVLARTAGINIVTDESLQPKRITTFFKDIPLREAFSLILTANRLFVKKAAENTVIVIPDNPGKRQQYDELTVRTFYLTDADAKVTVNLLRTILNTRQIFVNEKLNALVVRETPEKIAMAQKLLEANDRGVGEVEIELEVLEVDRTYEQNLGITISPQSYVVSLAFPASMPIGAVWPALRFGSSLSITNPSLILNLVKNDSHTKVLANPTVRILDRQKARLLIGQRRPFQISTLTSVPGVAGLAATGTTAATLPSSAVTTTQTQVEYRDIGLKLTLTPTVHLNGEVTVELSFEISSVGAAIQGVQGGELLTPVNTRNLDTFIKVRNGETRILGGLFQDTESVATSRIPFLADIPGLGRLFQSPDQTGDRTDVLISITPRIVKALERPEPNIEAFPSGTAESFGQAAPLPVPGLAPVPTPAPVPGGPAPAPRPPGTPGPEPPGPRP